MAADKLVALYSSHAVPYSMPWVAEELGLFKKYDIDFDFVYIPSSSTATAAILGSNVEVGLLGGVGIVNAYASGASGFGLYRQHQERHDPEHSRQARDHQTGAASRQTDRCDAHRQQHAFFHRPGVSPRRHESGQRFHLHPDRRRQRNVGRARLRSNRCGDDVAADRRPGASRWVSATSSSVPISAFPTRRRRLQRADR